MNITISLGWWLAPAIITLASFGWGRWAMGDSRSNYGDAVAGLFVYGAATIMALFAWLVWALLR